MSPKDTSQTSDEGTGETTAAFRAEFLGELDAIPECFSELADRFTARGHG